MQLNKSLNNFTDEELLAALNGNVVVKPEVKEPSQEIISSDSVLSFISRFNLKTGKYAVKNTLLYSLFVKLYPKTITRSKFNKDMSLYFNVDRDYRYLIDKDSMTLTVESLELLFNNRIIRGKKKHTSHRKTFLRFIDEFNIKTGEYFVPSRFLYDVLFDEYRKRRRKKNTMVYSVFNDLMKMHGYNRKITKNGTYYGINNEQKESFCKETSIQDYKKKQKKLRKA